MSERFLVTGSEGCIGSWVIKNLAEQGEFCVALDLVATGRRLGQIAGASVRDRVPLLSGDITTEGLIEAIAAEHGITRIIHLAALQIPLVRADPILGAKVNVLGTVRVFEAARRLAGQVRSVVYASSAAALGPPEPGGRPQTLYGVFKLCNEDTARLYAQDWSVSSLGLRPWAVFGLGRDQGLTAAPTHAMKAAVLGRRYHIPFGGSMDLQYADDVARAFIAAAQLGRDGAGVYNLRGSIIPMAQVVETIEAAWPQARGSLSCGEDPLPIPPELPGPYLHELVDDLPVTPFERAVGDTLELYQGLAAQGELTPADLEGV